MLHTRAIHTRTKSVTVYGKGKHNKRIVNNHEDFFVDSDGVPSPLKPIVAPVVRKDVTSEESSVKKKVKEKAKDKDGDSSATRPPLKSKVTSQTIPTLPPSSPSTITSKAKPNPTTGPTPRKATTRTIILPSNPKTKSNARTKPPPTPIDIHTRRDLPRAPHSSSSSSSFASAKTSQSISSSASNPNPNPNSDSMISASSSTSDIDIPSPKSIAKPLTQSRPLPIRRTYGKTSGRTILNTPGNGVRSKALDRGGHNVYREDTPSTPGTPFNKVSKPIVSKSKDISFGNGNDKSKAYSVVGGKRVIKRKVVESSPEKSIEVLVLSSSESSSSAAESIDSQSSSSSEEEEEEDSQPIITRPRRIARKATKRIIVDSSMDDSDAEEEDGSEFELKDEEDEEDEDMDVDVRKSRSRSGAGLSRVKKSSGGSKTVRSGDGDGDDLADILGGLNINKSNISSISGTGSKSKQMVSNATGKKIKVVKVQPIQQLLNSLDQSYLLEFQGFLESCDFLPITSASANSISNFKSSSGSGSGKSSASAGGGNKRFKSKAVVPLPTNSWEFKKIGEASYSEVFSVNKVGSGSDNGNGVIMKVIPLVTPAEDVKMSSNDEEDEDEVFSSEPLDVLREIEVTKIMAGLSDGFVQMYGAHIVHGPYPSQLLSAFDTFATDFPERAISSSPASLPSNQCYAVLLLSSGGQDLESYDFRTAVPSNENVGPWRKALGVVWQVVKVLSEAEEKGKFEHRDLHEGQVLVNHIASATSTESTVLSDPSFSGLQVTIIDFGLSRVDAPSASSFEDGEVFWSKIPEDVYDGVGEQWDVYRRMRDMIEAEDFEEGWEGYWPRTNVMWIHHLTRVLLYNLPSLRKPKQPKPSSASVSSPLKSPINPRERKRLGQGSRTLPNNRNNYTLASTSPEDRGEIWCYDVLLEMDHVLGRAVGFPFPKKGKAGRGKVMEFENCEDIVDWGRDKGWL